MLAEVERGSGGQNGINNDIIRDSLQIVAAMDCSLLCTILLMGLGFQVFFILFQFFLFVRILQLAGF